MRQPDLQGMFAKAWRYDLTLRAGDPPDWQGAIASWALTGPFHPTWSWWLVVAVHLRPIPAVRPPVLRFPDATHEFLIISVDPDCGTPDLDEARNQPPLLMPPDLVHQVGGLNDDQARELVEMMVRCCVAGVMSPDRDFREPWKRLIDSTVQHMVLGGHPKERA